MKKRLFRSIVILLIILPMFTVNISSRGPAFALSFQPQSITNTFGNDAATTHNFTWVTSPNIKVGVIEFCDKDEFTGFDQDNIQIKSASSVLTKTDSDTRMIHKVELENLKSGTQYFYRVGTDGSYSEQGEFWTASNETWTTGNQSSSFTFLNITDTQGATARDCALWKNTLDKALDQFPQARFLIHTGDMVDDGQKISQWNLFLGVASKELMNLTIAPAPGNHDVLNKNTTNANAKNFTESFNLPKEINTGVPPGTAYSFDYGNTHIAVINTECDSINLKKQADWLKLDMSGSTKLWKIVALHRGPYGATYDSAAIRKSLTPVFDELGIDLVLQGHDHNYVRSYSMRNETIAPDGRGTLYITGNSGGVKFYPLKPRSWQQVDLQPNTQMYIAVTVANNRMLIQAYDVNDVLRDSITLDKVVLFLDGVEIKSDAQPYINLDNRTMVPIRLIAEKLGAKVSWDTNNQSVTIINNTDKIKMAIGSNEVMVNNKTILMDTGPAVEDSRVMVPLRFVAEYMGTSVKWDAEQGIVELYSKTYSRK